MANMPNEHEFGDLLLSLMNDKTLAVKQLANDFQVCLENFEAMSKVIDNLEKHPDKIDAAKLHKAFSVALRSIFTMNQKLILLALIYYTNDTADGDIAKTLMKFGRGAEGLKAMLRNKMKGCGG